jgi:hypothetical protein
MTTPSRSPSTLELLLFFTAAIGILLAMVIFVLLAVVGFTAAGEGDAQMATFALWTGAGMAALALALTPAAYWSGRALFGAQRPPAGRPSAIWLAPPAPVMLGPGPGPTLRPTCWHLAALAC